jgi:hypothetical protein
MDLNPVIPVKKKRGRKPKAYYEELEKKGILPISDVPKEKKKRGRKPLKKNIDEEKKVPKKRGRKPKKTDYSIVDIEQVKFTEEEEDIILHIPIKMNNDTNNLLDNNISDDKNINFNPHPYDDNLLTQHSLIQQSNSDLSYNTILEKELGCNNSNTNKVNQILVPFKNFNKTGKWPEQVNIYCWHCCHPFKTKPVSIPIRYVNDTFYVYGVFCSYNCASAYNLNSNDYKKNENHQLLSLMYSKLYNTNNFIDISPAPPKEVLQIFGGNVTIDKYRNNFVTNNKEFKLIKPPLISIIPQVEETRRKTRKKEEYIPLNQNMIDSMNENLKLKRNKTSSSKNTLVELMGLQLS